MKSLRKKSYRNPGNKKFCKTNKKYSGKSFQQTGTSGRQNFRALMTNQILKKKTEEFQTTDTRAAKGICKNSVTPPKDKNLQIMGIKEEKRCNQTYG
jgi:hypothetical protein